MTTATSATAAARPARRTHAGGPGRAERADRPAQPARPAQPDRRAWLLRATGSVWAAASAALPGIAHAHDGLGPVTPPLAAPPLPLQLHDGRSTHLPAVLQGHVTAVHLMFTGCSALCPVQGAVFAELQSLVGGALPRAQLLSISIDPVGDDAVALAAWRRRFSAGTAWLAAAPPVRHAEAMPAFLGGRRQRETTGDRHNTQVYLFDRQGRLAYRCAEFASARSIAQAMQQLAARA